MTSPEESSPLRVHYDAHLPQVRWGPLFHVFRLEQPHATLEWRPAAFPSRNGSLLGDADVALRLEPPEDAGLSWLTLDRSPMAVIVAAGDPLAHREELRVADVLDRAFPGTPSSHPRWMAFWTLDAQRGAPPPFTEDDVTTAAEALDVVATGRAIATAPTWVATGLPHPGVIALPLRDGPEVRTRLVWRSDDDNQLVLSLIDLAAAWVKLGEDARDPG
jgi:DNA-binding transcriptional LysR family regulator